MRDFYVDIAKGICMLLIVCIHTEVFGVIGMPLTFVAVPMFFFMSGFYDRSETAWKDWLLKNIRALILPAVIWLVLSNLYLGFLGYIKTGELVAYHFDYINPQSGNGPVWFLLALFYTKCIVALLGRTCSNNVAIAILSLFIGYVGSAYQMPLCLDEGMAAVPLYWGAKLSYPFMKKMIADRRLLILGVILLSVFVLTPYYYNIGPSNHLYSPYYLLAIAGIFPVFILVLAISSRLGKMSWLGKIGKNTLGIMLVHAPMCHTAAVILNRLYEVGSLLWITTFLFAYVAIIATSLMLSLLIERYFPFLLGK